MKLEFGNPDHIRMNRATPPDETFSVMRLHRLVEDADLSMCYRTREDGTPYAIGIDGQVYDSVADAILTLLDAYPFLEW